MMDPLVDFDVQACSTFDDLLMLCHQWLLRPAWDLHNILHIGRGVALLMKAAGMSVMFTAWPLKKKKSNAFYAYLSALDVNGNHFHKGQQRDCNRI